MNILKVVLSIVLIAFVPFTVWCVATGGSFSEIWAVFVSNPWPIQVSLDLTLALILVCIWMWNDAKQHGRNALPWILATCFVGSIAPLTYLLMRPSETKPA